MYVTPDNKIITRMLHLPPDKNKLHMEHDVQSGRAHKPDYEIDNWSVYDMLD